MRRRVGELSERAGEVLLCGMRGQRATFLEPCCFILAPASGVVGRDVSRNRLGKAAATKIEQEIALDLFTENFCKPPIPRAVPHAPRVSALVSAATRWRTRVLCFLPGVVYSHLH